MDHEAVIAATRERIDKAVTGLNLCPFAKAVTVKNRVRYVASHAPHLDGLLEDLDREQDFLAAANPDAVDTTLLIHPTLLPDFLDFIRQCRTSPCRLTVKRILHFPGGKNRRIAPSNACVESRVFDARRAGDSWPAGGELIWSPVLSSTRLCRA